MSRSKKKDFQFLLHKAGIRRTPRKYFMLSAAMSFLVAFMVFFIFLAGALKNGLNIFPFLLFFLMFGFGMGVSLMIPHILINRRRQEVESDLIYSVRHFLLKLDSGSSFIRALEDVSTLPTTSSKYFAEVYYNIKMGASMKDAVLEAIKYSPSKEFRGVLEKVKNSILTGSDIKKSLKDVMDGMVEQKVLDIKKYGKKLSPATMMYMIFGTIVPSIGATIFVMASAFIGGGDSLSKVLLILISIILVAVQVSFYILFAQMRPKVSF